MTEGGFPKTLLRFAALLIALAVTGFFLRAEVNDLLNTTLEKTLAKQMAGLSIATEERFGKEFAELRLAAKYLEAYPAAQVEENFLSLLKAGNKNISVGMLRLDGSAIHGAPLSSGDFPRFPSTYRGNDVVDFCAGKGLLFAVPVMRGGNVRAVIYRLYDEKLLTELFELDDYHSDARLLIQDSDGKVIVPYKNYGAADKEFFANAAIQRGLDTVRDKLETQAAAAIYCESSLGQFFLFGADLPQMNCMMVGCVPKVSVARDIFKLHTFLLIGGLLMLILPALFGAYLIFVQTRAEENDALREAMRKADETNNAKSAFLANMSHKIRTPINAIAGMNEMILRESNNPKIIGYAQNSAAAVETLLSLVNDILDFTKIESGKIELIEEDYRLADVIKNLVNMIRPRAEKKNLEFKLSVNPAAENILRGDSERIQQIALNFLSNAVKYTQSGSVELIIDGETVSADTFILAFTVKDTGTGIREEDIPKLFDDFERFDIHKIQNAGSKGLGLAITYKLVKMMNGKIDIRSTYGEGSAFTALIPQKIAGNELIGVFTENPPAAQEKYKPAFVAPDAEILVVDDDEMNLLVATNLLKATQVKVDTASSGAACLKKLAERRYDLIFLDRMMPNLDGIQTLKRARAMENNLSKGAPIIALTADAVSGTQEKLIEAGFNDYLTKPIDVKLMEQILMDFLPAEKILPRTKSKPAPEKISDGGDLIDVDTGLEYCAGMTDMYKDVLLTFGSLKGEKQKKIQAAFDSGDWKNYQILVHALKSTALTIGATTLSERAKALELAAKDGDVDFIKQNHAETMKLYDILAEEAQRLADTL